MIQYSRGDFIPSSVTHNYFSVDVYNKLNDNIKKNINPCFKEYKIFAQGPDPYFFYDFHLTKKSIYVYSLSELIQHKNVNQQFISIINYINDKKFYSNSMVMAYLYGQICHYVLDSICHPFIIYYTGMYIKNNKETHKYNGLHEEMEYYIDCFLIYNRENILPRKYKAYKELFCNIKFNKEIKCLIDKVYYDVYGFNDVSSIYLKSIHDMKKFYHVFNYDRLGIKKLVYSIMDKILGNKVIKKKELSFHVDPNSKPFYLNLEKQKWCHPCIKNEFYNYSFFELYDIAMKKAIKIISSIDEMLKERKIDGKKIEKLLGNIDYATGKDCNLKLEYKYFRF